MPNTRLPNTKPKFNIGDRVKVTSVLHGAPQDTLGRTGEITKVFSPYEEDNRHYQVRLENYDSFEDTWYYEDEELELMTNSKPKFNIGDRVMWRDPTGELKSTHKGTVAAGAYDSDQVCIRFDEFPEHPQTHHESYIVHLDSEAAPESTQITEGPFVVLGIVPKTVTYKSYDEALEVAKSKAAGYPNTAYVIVSTKKVFRSVTEVKEGPLDA